MSELTIIGNHLEPKYKKLAQVLLTQIETGEYALKEQIPSIKQLAKTYGISRETVAKALNLLSEQGIIRAVHRQGYFVQKTKAEVGLRIFFLMDKMTEFKNRMYEAFLQTIGEQSEVHVFFHHHNYQLFQSLIEENLKNYTHFVVITYLEGDVQPILNKIPPEKRLILDNFEPGLEGNYAMVYQDFASDIYNCLKDAHSRLKKYRRLVLVSAHSRWGADEVLKGFNRFCEEYGFELEMTDDITKDNFQTNSVYIFLSNSDKKMVKAIKLSRQLNYATGKDIGIISYNDTYVNEVLEGGISVINTDFAAMGKIAARLVLAGDKSTVVNSSKLILRKSI